MTPLKTSAFAVLLLGLLPGLAAAQSFDSAGEAAMVTRINAMRAAQSLPPLLRNGGLDAAARVHCTDMAAQQQLTHVSDSSGTPADRVRRAGVTTTTVAENVALHQSASSAHEALLGSEAHRANMMSNSVTHVGIAALPTEQGVYVTQVFAAIGLPAPAAPAIAEPATHAHPAPSVEIPTVPGVPIVPEVAAVGPSVGASGRVFEVQEGTGGTVIHELSSQGGTVRAYWVHDSGRWWYYPMPAGALPGQQLQVDMSVTGPPPGFSEQPGGPRTAVAIPPASSATPGPRVQAVGPGVPAPIRGEGGRIVMRPFAGQVVVPGGSFYAVPPPPMTGQPDRNWRRSQRQWQRAYRRWQAQQRRAARRAL